MNHADLNSALQNLTVAELKMIGKTLNIPKSYKTRKKNRKVLEDKILSKENKIVISLLQELGHIPQISSKKFSMMEYLPFIGLGLAIVGILLGIYYFRTGKNSSLRSTEAQFKTSFKYDKLEEKYPFGFKVFGLRSDGKLILADPSDEPSIDIIADWDKFSLRKANGSIYLNLPKLSFKSKPSNRLNFKGKFSQNETVFPDKVYKNELALGGIFIPGEPAPFYEKIFSVEEDPIYVIGIKNVTQADIDFYDNSGAYVNLNLRIDNLDFN